MAVSEHLTWPLTVGDSGLLVTAPQNSDMEIASCMAVVLLWPQGTRDTDPEFGIADQVGLQGGASLAELRTALARYEPRAAETLTQDDAALAQFASNVTVGWTPATGASS